MSLGKSGGRSQGNRQGEGAQRRYLHMERDQRVPSYLRDPLDESKPATGYRLTPRGEHLLELFAIASFGGFVALLCFIIAVWWTG